MLADRYDLPLSTHSPAARDAYVQGSDLALTLYPGALEAFDRAIAIDPGFAMAHAGKAQVLIRQGNVAAGREALATAKDRAAGLPEREASHIAFFDQVFSGRSDAAAMASGDCAELYGLSVLSYNISNSDSNYTRFICISKQPEIYPGANRTSLMLTLKNNPGSLYGVLAKFNALGVNLIKLESRPISGSDFEFMFYFDIDASVYSDALREIVAQLENETAMFGYLGSYQEI